MNEEERIWAWEYEGNSPWGPLKPNFDLVENGAEYVRIDLFENLEAKLAKAVEALRFYGGVMPVSFSPGQDGGAKARTTLAELTGGPDA